MAALDDVIGKTVVLATFLRGFDDVPEVQVRVNKQRELVITVPIPSMPTKLLTVECGQLPDGVDEKQALAQFGREQKVFVELSEERALQILGLYTMPKELMELKKSLQLVGLGFSE